MINSKAGRIKVNYSKLVISNLLFCLFFASLDASEVQKYKIIRQKPKDYSQTNGELVCKINNCIYKTNKRSTLAAHKTRQHNNNAFHCPWCKVIYGLSDSRLKHIERDHLEEYDMFLRAGRSLRNYKFKPEDNQIIWKSRCEDESCSNDESVIIEPVAQMNEKDQIDEENDKCIKKRAPKTKAIKSIKKSIKDQSERPCKKIKVKKEDSTSDNSPEEQSSSLIDPCKYPIEVIDLQNELDLFYNPTIKDAIVYTVL